MDKLDRLERLCQAFLDAGVFTEESFWRFGWDCPKSHWTADVWEMYRKLEVN